MARMFAGTMAGNLDCFGVLALNLLSRSRTGPGRSCANGPDNRAFRPTLPRRPKGRLGGMMRMILQRTWVWLRQHSALVLLVVTRPAE